MTSQLATTRTKRSYSSSPEWYTPRWLLERISAFLGPDWYDPCPASLGKLQTNGLSESWRGRAVYCNPPYGRDIKPWIRKATTEHTAEIILLLPASTDTQWFQPLFAGSSLCFVAGRVYFERPQNHAAHAAPHGSVLVYRGKRHRAFADAFCELGTVMRTYRAHKRWLKPTLFDGLDAETETETAEVAYG